MASAYDSVCTWAKEAGPAWTVTPPKTGRYRLLYRGGKVFRGNNVRDGLSCFVDCANRDDIPALDQFGQMAKAGFNDERGGVGYRFNYERLDNFLEWCRDVAPKRALSQFSG